MAETIESYKISPRIDDGIIVPEQSANSLFHFVGKMEYLEDIIRDMAMKPRYCEENIKYLDIGISNLAYPMLCFCDINFHKLKSHIKIYGGDGYGIALAKNMGMSKGIQPIQYINEKSFVKKDFAEAIKDSLARKATDKASDFLLTQIQFFKPIQGRMKRDGDFITKNFTDECEWRYIPDLRGSDYLPVLMGDDLLRRDVKNEEIRGYENCWLKITLDAIKYIVVKTKEDSDGMIELIKNINKNLLKKEDQLKLISRIIVWDEAKDDF